MLNPSSSYSENRYPKPLFSSLVEFKRRVLLLIPQNTQQPTTETETEGTITPCDIQVGPILLGAFKAKYVLLTPTLSGHLIARRVDGTAQITLTTCEA